MSPEHHDPDEAYTEEELDDLLAAAEATTQPAPPSAAYHAGTAPEDGEVVADIPLEEIDDVEIDPAPEEAREGWRYPYDPHPKQQLASEFLTDEMLFGGAAGPGKDVDVSTPVWTADGWSTQGSLRIGDKVLTPAGTWTTVVAAYPVESNPCYKVSFSTGETITAGEGHLWALFRKGGDPEIIETKDLYTRFHTPKRQGGPNGPIRLPKTPYDERITITDVRPTATVPTRCVAVDDPDKLYLIGRTLIPTHNTDWCLAECVNLCLAVPEGKVLLLRATYGELQEEIIPRLNNRIPPWVGKYSSKANAIIFYNGARLRLGYLGREDDKKQYIGAEYILIAWDELTQLPWGAYEFMRSRLRATGAVDAALTRLGLRPRMIATSNPGGPYHMHVKRHFVDPAPPGTIVKDKASQLTRVYVPAVVDDNPSMPPSYRRMLMGLPEDKRRALLEGSWDVLEGVRFSQWNYNTHVIDPEMLPLPLLSGERVIAIDYGFSDPAAAVWGVKLSDGLIVIYREMYERELTATEQARLIMQMTTPEEHNAGFHVVVDPSTYGRRDATAPRNMGMGPPMGSPAYDYMQVFGKEPIKANNHRTHGWAKLDDKLRVRGDGWPRLLVYSTCTNLIRTLPSLQRSKTNPEDIAGNPKQDDHLGDSLRYLCMYMDPFDPVNKYPGEIKRRPKARRAISAGMHNRGIDRAF